MFNARLAALHATCLARSIATQVEGDRLLIESVDVVFDDSTGAWQVACNWVDASNWTQYELNKWLAF